jgi:hypothetical protein
MYFFILFLTKTTNRFILIDLLLSKSSVKESKKVILSGFGQYELNMNSKIKIFEFYSPISAANSATAFTVHFSYVRLVFGICIINLYRAIGSTVGYVSGFADSTYQVG